jgi:lipopolysaccharide transport system permease protein
MVLAWVVLAWVVKYAAETRRRSFKGSLLGTKRYSTKGHQSAGAGEAQRPTTTMPTILIRPTRGWMPANVKELFEFRELLYFLVWSDLRKRYKQTLLGASWAVIQPVAIMLVVTVFFGIVVRVPTGEIPYPIFTYSGLVVWWYFSTALSRSSRSLMENNQLITKVYFPRLLLPVGSAIAGLVDFAYSFVVLIALVGLYGFLHPTASVFLLPLFLVLATMTALAISLWLSALNVQYRDAGLFVPILLQLWFFSTPIIYPAHLVPERWRILYEIINPMVGVVEGFRWAILGRGDAPNPTTLALSVALVTTVFVGGLYYFRRIEKTFADVM